LIISLDDIVLSMRGIQILGDTILGDTILGDTILGVTILGDTILGDTILGDTILGVEDKLLLTIVAESAIIDLLIININKYHINFKWVI
jgi:hypothetical protein